MAGNRFFVIIILLLITFSLFSFENDIKFDRLSRNDGLSNSTVYSIIQDRKGFMWFGTPDGLNKYDGRAFTVYKNKLNDQKSIPNNSAGNLFIDSNGIIWIGTWGGGLVRFDPRYDAFSSYTNDPDNETSLSDNRVQSLYEDRTGQLWFGTYNGGINRFDSVSGEFQSFINNPGDNTTISHNRIWVIGEDNQGILWIGTSSGLNRFDNKNENFTLIKNTADFIVRNLLITSDGKFWFGTNDGLFLYDREKDIINETPFKDRIYALFEDSRGYLWIGTSDGLVRFDYKKNEYTRFKSVPENFYSLTINSVRSIFEDSSGVIWIGTEGGGLCKFNNYPKDFVHYFSDTSIPYSLSNNNVFAIEEDDFGYIWLGTRAGLNRWDRNLNKFIHYRNNEEIRALEADPSGDLWVGTRNGLDRYIKSTDDFYHYDYPIPEIRSILRDSSGTIWIGTYKNGLYQFNSGEGTFVNHLPDSEKEGSLNHREIWAGFEDSFGDIWIGTGEGLNRLKKGSDSFLSYKIDKLDSETLLGIRVFTVFEDSKNSIWIGTDEGLNLWDRKSDRFSGIVMEDGMADKSVKSIIEDNEDNLWLGSNDGLTKYNPVTGAMYNYGIGDNLQGREFYSNSVLLTTNGSILFGGVEGFNSFNPSRIKESSYSPPVVLTGFSVLGETITFDRSSSYIDNIDLSYKQNFFTLQFAVLDFSSSNGNHYAYILEGVDKNWIYMNNRNHVSYTEIGGGDYTFRIKATNRDNIWNEDELVLTISVTTPPWRRWWAYLCYITVLILLIAKYVSWKTSKEKKIIARQKQFVEKLEEKVLERTAELNLVNKKFEKLSNTDALTSLYNMRYFEKRYHSEWSRLQRVNLPLSVLMCDIDHFKLYNDFYGHPAGDLCIRKVADTITENCVRTSDILVRYGGEEFLVVLPQTDTAGALNIAEAIVKSVEGKRIMHKKSSTSDSVTISIGVASIIPSFNISPMVLVEHADKALYESKNRGRNQAFLYKKNSSELKN